MDNLPALPDRYLLDQSHTNLPALPYILHLIMKIYVRWFRNMGLWSLIQSSPGTVTPNRKKAQLVWLHRHRSF